MALNCSMEKSIKAYAKVNLHLEVLNRRDDGYHEIFSLMAMIGLHDLLKLDSTQLTPGKGPVEVVFNEISGKYAYLFKEIPIADNLITRSIEKFSARADICGKIAISIEKNIPSGAGLGGGSADAAAALKLMNAANSSILTDKDLHEIGSNLGADIPFCLNGKAAICEGIGDIIEPLNGTLGGYVLILNDGIHCDTGKAYKALKRDNNPTINEKEIIRKKNIFREMFLKGNLSSASGILKNDFEEPVFSEHPAIREIKSMAMDEGADYAAMTGSGSSVIALFAEREKAFKAETKLSKKIRNVIITDFIK